MKLLSAVCLVCCTLAVAGCSRSDDRGAAAGQPTQTPNEKIPADAERLQKATAKIAKEKEAPQQPSPTPAAPQP